MECVGSSKVGAVYICPKAPLVLFSLLDPVNPVPLASLTVKPVGKNVDGLSALIWARPTDGTADDAAHFQALINQDNVEVEFEIANLTNARVVFNILKNDNFLNVKEPDNRINEVNELRAKERYWITGDYTKNNKAFFLEALTGSVRAMETESQGVASRTTGCYLYLHVSPERGHRQSNLFGKTEWRAVDYYLTQRPDPRYRDPAAEEDDEDDDEDVFGGIPMRSANPCRTAMPRSRLLPQQLCNELMFSSNVGSKSKSFTAAFATACSTAFVTKAACPERQEAIEEDLAFNLFDSETTATPTFTVAPITPLPTTVPDKRKLLDTARAVAMKVSERQVVVQSYSTGIDYDFTLTSGHCVLCLSIVPELVFASAHVAHEAVVTAAKTALAQLEMAAEAEVTTVLYGHKPVFTSDDCVLCLEPLVTRSYMTFYRCGHECMHVSCDERKNTTASLIPTCPLCRGAIVARVIKVV